MNTITNLFLPKGKTPLQPELFVRGNGRMNGEFNRTDERHFQLSTEWRNDNQDDPACECVIGPKTCVRNPLLPLRNLFPHMESRLSSAAAIGSGGRRQGGFTNYRRTRQGELTFV